MKKRIWTYIIGFIFILGGILLLINPDAGISNIVKYLGVVLLVTGIIKILYSLFTKEYFKDNSLSTGIVNAIFGIILLFNAKTTISFVSIFIGIWLMLSSVFSLLILFKGSIISGRMLFSSIFKLVLGIIIIATPVITWVFTGLVVGIVLIIAGLYIIFSYKDNSSVYKIKVKK